VSAPVEPIRSYQRIFRPERRIYQVEGHSLPVPGGLSLRWIAYTAAALVAAVALGSTAVDLLFALGAAAGGWLLGGRAAAGVAAVCAFAGASVLGLALGALDWPLRLIVVPAAVGTFATQATPDGRRADRFALSWLALRLAPRRRSLGRALPPTGVAVCSGGELWVASGSRANRVARP
jgi:hypothetical protein